MFELTKHITQALFGSTKKFFACLFKHKSIMIHEVCKLTPACINHFVHFVEIPNVDQGQVAEASPAERKQGRFPPDPWCHLIGHCHQE